MDHWAVISGWTIFRATTPGSAAALWYANEAGDHRLGRRVGEGADPGLETGLLAGGDYAVVVAGSEFAREQQQCLVLEAGDWNRVGVGQAVVLAGQQGKRFRAQQPAAHPSHGLGEQGEPDVLLPGEHPVGDLGAEELAGNYGHVRAVVPPSPAP